MTDVPSTDSARARSFGAAAAEYDRYRPRYPDQLVADVVALVPGRRVLEVGAGTGIATAAFAARGMVMTCIEPDAQMVAVLSTRLAGDADLHVDVSTFEQWSAARPADAPGFDALVSAQAWHWTDPTTRWANAGTAVRSGGVIALFWNEDHHADPRVTDAFLAAYERRGIEVHSVRQESTPSSDPDGNGNHPESWPESETDAHEYFTNLRTHRYHWTHRVSVVDYVARVNTTSAHLILPPEAREDLTAELITTLTGYGDEIELAMVTELATGVRR